MTSTSTSTSRVELGEPGHLTLRPGGRADWALHERDAGATTFHSWDWLSWVSPLIDCEFVPLIVEEDGRSVGLAPMLLRRRFAVHTANLVPFPYLGPAVAAPRLAAAAALVRRWSVMRGVVHGKQGATPGTGVPEGCFTAAGLVEERDETYVLPLVDRSLDEIAAAVSRSVHEGVRRSVARGVVVRESTPAELRTTLADLHAQAMGATPEYTRRIGAALADGAPPFPVRCTTAELDGAAIGMCVTVGGRVAEGWLSGVEHRARNTQAYTAMMWDSIVWAHGAGSEALDMMRAPTPGIAMYKRKFHPVVQPYTEGTWRFPGIEAARVLGTRAVSTVSALRHRR